MSNLVYCSQRHFIMIQCAAAYKIAKAMGAWQIRVRAAVAQHPEVAALCIDTFDVAPKTAPTPPTAAQKTSALRRKSFGL